MDTLVYTDLFGLRDLVHEASFDLTECEFDEQSQAFRLSLGYSVDPPYRDRLLTVKPVREVVVHDRAQIQMQAINEIEVDESRVRITCTVPVEIRLMLDGPPELSILMHPLSRLRQRFG